MLSEVTPIILTYNEEANIARTLRALHWAKQVLVVDSYSSDNTLEICKTFDNVEVVQRKFDQHTKQWNFAREQKLTSPWVLALDADHVVTKPFIEELTALKPEPTTSAYRVSYIYMIDGKPLTGSLYPPLLALYRPTECHYIQDGHTQRLQTVTGNSMTMQASIAHDDRKPHSRWLRSQHNYALLETNKLRNTPFSELGWTDRVRKIPGLAPLAVIPYLLVGKRLLLDGAAGLKYLRQRITAESILQYYLYLAPLKKLLQNRR